MKKVFLLRQLTVCYLILVLNFGITSISYRSIFAFDEFRGTHNSYHFICLDSDNHVIQTILPNRFKDTIIKYFMKFPESVRQLVRTVSCDLNSYYVDIAKTLLPNAKIIIDRFHIVQMLNRALNSMRTDLMNNFEHSSKNYKLFKRNWKLFLKRYDDLDCTHQFYERSLKNLDYFRALSKFGT